MEIKILHFQHKVGGDSAFCKNKSRNCTFCTYRKGFCSFADVGMGLLFSLLLRGKGIYIVLQRREKES